MSKNDPGDTAALRKPPTAPRGTHCPEPGERPLNTTQHPRPQGRIPSSRRPHQSPTPKPLAAAIAIRIAAISVRLMSEPGAIVTGFFSVQDSQCPRSFATRLHFLLHSTSRRFLDFHINRRIIVIPQIFTVIRISWRFSFPVNVLLPKPSDSEIRY